MKWIIVLYALSGDGQPIDRLDDPRDQFESQVQCDMTRQAIDAKVILQLGMLPFRSRCEPAGRPT